MTIKEALEHGRERLQSITPTALKETYIILSHLLNKDKIWLMLHEDEEINHTDFNNLIDQRVNHTPIEYITNSVSFYSREFYIAHGALIPRPETELLIDQVLKLSKNFNRQIKIAEIGVGSGVISVMLALLSNSQLIATDISKEALKIAKINIKKYNLEDKIKLIHTNLLENIDEEFDIIVSNPPYIKDHTKLEPHLSAEPQNALFGGNRGDEILQKIITIFNNSNTKYLACEMGYDQKEYIKEYTKELNLKNIHFFKDLAGLNRGFVIEK